MKNLILRNQISRHSSYRFLKTSIIAFGIGLFSLLTFSINAQEETENKVVQKPVRSMFESSWLIDNQSAVVPIKGTLQMDMLHRFGVWKNGYDNFFGIFAPSNIRIGFNYSLHNNLALGFGLTKENNLLDFNLKYGLFHQTRSGSFPISITYFANAARENKDDEYEKSSHRLSYFHQLIFARKFNDKLSLQIAPSLSHFNAVLGFIDSNQEEVSIMNNDHLAVSFGGRYKFKDEMSFIFNYDLPITDHFDNNPESNLSFGIEMATSAHAFQVFVGNFRSIMPQRNNFLNQNSFADNEILLGFNITRLWVY